MDVSPVHGPSRIAIAHRSIGWFRGDRGGGPAQVAHANRLAVSGQSLTYRPWSPVLNKGDPVI